MRLTKHHGLGNDFLVLLDAEASHPLDADTTRTLCDRHMGVGADGLIRATPLDGGGAAVAAMELRNADGSEAEMSGNGIRCLAQALMLAGWVREMPVGSAVAIRTAAGVRSVTLHGRPDARTHTLSVGMGSARIDGEAPEWTGEVVHRALRVDVGNPHLVAELATGLAPDAVDLVDLGERVNAKVPGGANVHVLVPDGPGRIAIRSYERGVGPTLACGTGACAAAVAARAWGLVGDSVTVDQPGGSAEVSVEDHGTVVLGGPATFVATVELPEGWPEPVRPGEREPWR
ncbi:MAG TPA: diaminopimelate epimerase [Acidimicrobiales bacterium]|jgi:diaminopimelate epimerase|nr:diaminopimelate epimerase [Acidimicrobiales bacterium]